MLKTEAHLGGRRTSSGINNDAEPGHTFQRDEFGAEICTQDSRLLE